MARRAARRERRQAGGRELTQAVERAFATGTLVPVEFGGTADTQAVFRSVHDELTRHPVTANLTA